MAVFNLQPVSKGDEFFDADDATLDLVHFGYTRVMQDLLPPGRAFTRRTGTVLQKLLAGLGMEFSRIQKGIRQMLREAKPDTAYKALDLWETLLGLPDCEEPTTLAGRRAVAAAKLAAAAGHTQEPAWWESLFEGLGYELVDYLNFGGFVGDCADDCLDGIFPSEWQFVVWLLANHGASDELLGCQVEAEQLLGMDLQMHWMWEQQENPVDPVQSLFGVASSQHGWTVAVGSGGAIVRAKEFLSTWTEITPPALFSLYGVCCAGGNLMIAVGEGPGALVSTDGGENWTNEIFAAGELYGVSRVDTNVAEAVAVGDGGGIWKATTNGTVWASKPSPVATMLYAVTRASGAMIAVGEGGVIIRSTDAGETWGAVASGTTEHLYGVSGWGDDVVAVGDNGTILVSDDAGATWSAATSGTTDDMRAVDIAPTGRWIVAGLTGSLLQSADKGVTWTAQGAPVITDLLAVGHSALLGQAVVVGASNVILLE